MNSTNIELLQVVEKICMLSYFINRCLTMDFVDHYVWHYYTGKKVDLPAGAGHENCAQQYRKLLLYSGCDILPSAF